MVKVRVPDPPQVRQVVFLAPGLRPLPEQGLQSTTGETLTVLVVPLAASKKGRVMETSMLSPTCCP
jgi:hypothetical protein